MIDKERKIVQIAMPIELYEQLKHVAIQDSRSISGELRQIIKGYIHYIDRGGVSWCRNPGNQGIERYDK